MARLSEKDAKYLKQARHCVESSKKWRKDKGYDDTWKRLIALYANKHFDEKRMKEGERIAVNYAFATINVILPSTTVNYPKVTVKAVREELQDAAYVVECVDNYYWRHFRWKRPLRRAVKDSLIIGHGWGKTTYRYETSVVAKTAEEIQAEVDQAMAQHQQYAMQAPDMAGSLPSPEDVIAGIAPKREVVTVDQPTFERVSPYDIFVDPDATSIDDLRWIAQRVWTPIDELRKNPNYKSSSIVAHYANKGDKSYESASDFDGGDRNKREDNGKYVQVYEYYDVTAGTMCVFADIGDDYLVAPQEMPYAFGHPFLMLRNYDVPDQFYPLGDLECIEQLQQELNETRSQMFNDRKRYRRKYLARESALTPDGIADLESDEDNVIVLIEGDQPLTDVVVPVPQTAVPPDFYNQSTLIEDDINQISGVSEYMRGGMPEIRRTATEASIMADAINARSADKLAQVEDFVGEVSSRVTALAQQFLTGDHVARIEGEDGAAVWVPFDRDSIQGEFDFEVVGGSTQPNNESFRRQSAMQMMDAVAPLAASGVINMAELAKHVLREGFGVKDVERFIIPMSTDPLTGMPIPPAQAQAQAQDMLMAAQGAPGGPTGPSDGGQTKAAA